LLLRKGWIVALDEGASNDSLKSMGKLEGTLLILLDPVPETELQDQIDEVIESIGTSGQLEFLVNELAKQVVPPLADPPKGDDGGNEDWLETPIVDDGFSSESDTGINDRSTTSTIDVDDSKRRKKTRQPKPKRSKSSKDEIQKTSTFIDDDFPSPFD
jgi:hypothetical protein